MSNTFRMVTTLSSLRTYATTSLTASTAQTNQKGLFGLNSNREIAFRLALSRYLSKIHADLSHAAKFQIIQTKVKRCVRDAIKMHREQFMLDANATTIDTSGANHSYLRVLWSQTSEHVRLRILVYWPKPIQLRAEDHLPDKPQRKTQVQPDDTMLTVAEFCQAVCTEDQDKDWCQLCNSWSGKRTDLWRNKSWHKIVTFNTIGSTTCLGFP